MNAYHYQCLSNNYILISTLFTNYAIHPNPSLVSAYLPKRVSVNRGQIKIIPSNKIKNKYFICALYWKYKTKRHLCKTIVVPLRR